MKSSAGESKWLAAFEDPLASVYTFTSCISLANLTGDGDYKLVIADLGTGMYSMKLIVYKGTKIVSENIILDLPTAAVPFFMDSIEPRVAAVAVASGSALYIYKNLKPYYKFVVPGGEVNTAEAAIWQLSNNDDPDIKHLKSALQSLSETLPESELTARTKHFLIKPDQEKEAFVKMYQKEPLKKESVVTVLTTMKRSSPDPEEIDCLIVGLETGKVTILDSEAFTVLAEAFVPDVPAFIKAAGLYDVDFRIVIVTRDAKMYVLKREQKTAEKPMVELLSHAVGMCRLGKHVVIACCDKSLRCYSFKGKKLWSLHMPAEITTIESLEHVQKNIHAVIVALENNEVRIYRDMDFVDVLEVNSPVVALKFGTFGREEGALVMVHRDGSLAVKLLKRTVNFQERITEAGPHAAQAQRLNVPKRTKIFVDQTMHEREFAEKMHHTFQRDLFLLKLHTAETYAGVVTKKETPIFVGQDEMLKLSAEIQGFGPRFLMIIYLECISNVAVSNLYITFHYNTKLYEIQKHVISAPFLIPNVQYPFDTYIKCVSDKAVSEDIKVLVCKYKQSSPLLTAAVTMPVSEESFI